MSDLSLLLHQEITSLTPSGVVELFTLDARPCGDSTVLHFHNGSAGLTQVSYPESGLQQINPLVPSVLTLSDGVAGTVSFMEQQYQPLPIWVTGFEHTTQGAPPRPTLKIMNLGGFMSAWLLKTNDLVGALLIRRRTFAKFLDGASKDKAQYPPDVYRIMQKTSENRMTVEFELGSTLELDGVLFPTRSVQSGYCSLKYRGAGCNFNGYYAVSGNNGTSLSGIDRMVGSYVAGVTYAAFSTVTYVSPPPESDRGLYQSFVVTDANPTDTTKWQRLQHWRGTYDTTVAYSRNDVVTVDRYGTPVMFLALSDVPANAGLMPPNETFWLEDRCGKYLSHCKQHFDPFSSGTSVLPFGGFPGILNIIGT